jgi:drug/metabolite transporter (DMT)-like permease
VLLAALTVGWGFNWPMMKIALGEVPVWTFRGLCAGAGALGMFVIARANRRAILPPSNQWRRLAASAVFNVTLWNVCIAYGLTFLPAGRTVILAYTMPLWVVLLSRLLLDERLTRRRVAGVTLGMAGMALLIGNELAAMRAAPIGALLVIAAAAAWAIGTVLMKRFPTQLPTTSFTGWQFLIGGAPIVFGALVLDHSRWQPVSIGAAAAVLYNMVVAFVFCHWAWFKIVSRASAGVSALGTLMIPVVGVLSSMLVLGERPSWQEYGALLLVMGAIATVVIPRPVQAVAGER